VTLRDLKALCVVLLAIITLKAYLRNSNMAPFLTFFNCWWPQLQPSASDSITRCGTELLVLNTEPLSSFPVQVLCSKQPIRLDVCDDSGPLHIAFGTASSCYSGFEASALRVRVRACLSKLPNNTLFVNVSTRKTQGRWEMIIPYLNFQDSLNVFYMKIVN
jgi:hypothetical protein